MRARQSGHVISISSLTGIVGIDGSSINRAATFAVAGWPESVVSAGTVSPMAVVRIVPNLPVNDVTRANELFANLFDLDVGMDLGWVGNLSPRDSPSAQLQTITQDAAAPCNPLVSVGVASPDEVDVVHDRVVGAGLRIVHPPTDEAWGVRRFFFEDPDGNVINVVANR